MQSLSNQKPRCNSVGERPAKRLERRRRSVGPSEKGVTSLSFLCFIGGLCLLSIATYSGVSLLQYYLASRGKNDEFLAAFAISLFLIYFIGDQIYGNFFMMPGFALMCGFAAMLNSTRKTGDKSNA